jgi:hypothetical protein
VGSRGGKEHGLGVWAENAGKGAATRRRRRWRSREERFMGSGSGGQTESAAQEGLEIWESSTRSRVAAHRSVRGGVMKGEAVAVP